MKIGILNYNIGNLANVQNAFAQISRVEVCIENDADKLYIYDKLVLPGVGAFGDAMKYLRQSGMTEAIYEYVKSGKYLLGICLGAQILFSKGYEFGEHAGLNLIDGDIVPFPKDELKGLKIPHIGWNTCNIVRAHGLLDGLRDGFFLYFVHSFYIKTGAENILVNSDYGISFPTIIAKDNVLGIQPHPEKSHDVGLAILKNFINL